MDAKETIKYLYTHGHIPDHEHYKTILDELDKPIAEHPDVQESERIINSCKKKWLDYIARKETKDE